MARRAPTRSHSPEIFERAKWLQDEVSATLAAIQSLQCVSRLHAVPKSPAASPSASHLRKRARAGAA